PVRLTVKPAIVWDGPTVNVKNFGAKGDGVTDDTAAIRKAFEAVRMTPNATIYFPRGTYLVTESMYLVGTYGTAQRLLGDGSGVTTIRAMSGSQQASIVQP